MSTVALEVLEGWAPSGKKIVGTYDKVPGVALAYTYYRDPVDGHVEAEYEGETKLRWNDCEAQYATNGQRLYVDEDDGLWAENEIEWLPESKKPIVLAEGESGECDDEDDDYEW